MKKLVYSLTFIFLCSGTSWAQLSGARIVPSANYPDLKTVADSLNAYGVGSGGISFMLQGGSTFEETPIEFTATGNIDDQIYIGWDGIGDKPVVNFEGTNADGEAGFTISGADYYTLSGFAITNSNSNLEIGILINNLNDQDGAHYNTVKNVDITLDKLNAYQTVGISVSAGTAPTQFEGNNHYNKFYNNSISNLWIGYHFDGATSTTEFMSVGNEVNSQDGGESIIFDIVMAGVSAEDQHGFTISNTTIRDVTRIGTGNTAPAAIATSSGNSSEMLTNEIIISNNTIENMTSSFTSIFGMYLSARKVTYQIYNNKIDNVTATGGGTNTADGIMVLASTVVTNIYNNMISGIAAPASAVSNNAATRGITVRTYDLANVFYNTVVLEYEATEPANSSAAFMMYNNSDPVLLRNNIFINKTTLPEDATGRVTAFYKRNNTVAGITEQSDNNIYYAGIPGPQNTIYYGHNSTTPALHETLEDYKIFASTFDQNSFTEDVQFVSPDDLHILASANTVARNNATPVTDPIEITTDIDGTIRDSATPDIGADEIASELPDVAINPNPTDGELEVSVDLDQLSWEFYTSAEFTTPEAFLVYFGESSDFEGATPVATVLWEDGVTNYSVSIDPLESQTDYYWQVVPTTDLVNGETPETVTVWMFSTESQVLLYPNPAENPSPTDGEILDLPEDHVLLFQWDYNPSPNHSLPVYFAIYGAGDILADEWQIPMATVDYNEGQISYEIEFTDHPNFTYEELYSNHWKIVPVAADDIASPDVPVWEFTFDETIGLNELTSEGTLIYPNPANDFVNIEPGFEGNYEVILYDLQGRLIKHFGENRGNRNLNISTVQTGAYQLVIKQGDLRFGTLIKIK